MIWTLFCAYRLILVHEKVGGGTYPILAYKCYGKKGKIVTDISLFGS
jgi:hypothetical protein